MGVENNIPEGWIETSIGKVTVVESGGTPSTKNPSYWGDEIPWITPRDLSSFKDMFIEKGERSISIKGLENSSAKLLPKNTILFSSRAPIGYVVIAQNEITTNQGFKNIICDEANSHFKYFYYLMQYKADFIERLSSGSTFSEASGTLIKSIEINLPPLTEQKAIAKVLTAFDDKIELLQAQNNTLETMAQTIFKEWFGKYQIGDELPEGWRVGKIEDLTEKMQSGGTPSTKNKAYYTGDISWFSTKELKDNFLLSSIKHINKDAVKNSSTKLFPRNSVLMAIYAAPTVGRLGILNHASCFNQAAVALVPNSNVQYAYLYLLLKYHRKDLNNLANGAAQQNLNVGLVKAFKTKIPHEKLLSLFNKKVIPIFEKIRHNAESIQSLTKTRDTLLPKLMSGQVRVNGFKK